MPLRVPDLSVLLRQKVAELPDEGAAAATKADLQVLVDKLDAQHEQAVIEQRERAASEKRTGRRQLWLGLLLGLPLGLLGSYLAYMLGIN